MNERIRQLSIKAGGRRDYEKYHKQSWNFSESELDKFADLIRADERIRVATYISKETYAEETASDCVWRIQAMENP